jgi:hypothetical protein
MRLMGGSNLGLRGRFTPPLPKTTFHRPPSSSRSAASQRPCSASAWRRCLDDPVLPNRVPSRTVERIRGALCKCPCLWAPIARPSPQQAAASQASRAWNHPCRSSPNRSPGRPPAVHAKRSACKLNRHLPRQLSLSTHQHPRHPQVPIRRSWYRFFVTATTVPSASLSSQSHW